jgi:ketosteroid isomerase-like protein
MRFALGSMPGLFCGLAILLGVLSSAAGEQPARATARPAPPAALPSVALPPELDRVLRDYERAWRAHDAAALAALFAEDGFVMSNGNPPVRGREAIRTAYTNSGGPLALRALAWETEGKVGYIIGGFGRQEGSLDTGKFVLALRRAADGRWLIAADMDNSNRRPQPTAPTPTPAPPPN